MTIGGLWFALNLCLWIYSVSTTASLGEGVHHEPVDAVCAAHRMGDDENTPCPGILGVPAGRDRRPRAAGLHMPIAFHPSQGWFLLTALVQSIWFCYTSRCARDVPDSADHRAAGDYRTRRAGGSPLPSKPGTSRLRYPLSAGCWPVLLSPPVCASACK